MERSSSMLRRPQSARTSSRMSTKSSSKRSLNDIRFDSRRSARASSTRSLSKRLKSITEDGDQSENIVRSIMDEIMNTVMDKAYQIYIDKQAVPFVVHCAHEAFMNVIKMHFYRHNEYKWDAKNWSSGKVPTASPPDSWAVNQVPNFKKDPSERALNTISQIKMRAREQAREQGKTDVSHVFSDVDLEALKALHSETLVSDMEGLVNKLIDDLPLNIEEEEEFSFDVEREPSHFTQVLKGAAHFTEYRMSPQVSRIKIGRSVDLKLPRIPMPDSDESRKNMSCCQLGKLPPIRITANYNCKTTKEDEEDKDSKKKNTLK